MRTQCPGGRGLEKIGIRRGFLNDLRREELQDDRIVQDFWLAVIKMKKGSKECDSDSGLAGATLFGDRVKVWHYTKCTKYLFLDLGTRLRGAGVKAIDHVVISFLHHTSLKLHREGESAIVEGEIFGQQCESLDGLVLR